LANGERRAIKYVQVGDEVLATDPETGETGGREVLATMPHTDQLLTLRLSDYTYDTFDRIATRDTDTFTYTGLSIDPTGDGTDSYARTPAGSLLAVEGTSGFRFPLTDLHGDVIGLIDPAGDLVGSTIYNPYGEVDNQDGETSLLGFQGDWTDPFTDNIWMGARWYQPSSATFLTRDTYQGELHTPFTLNRYTYALNNPNRYWVLPAALHGDGSAALYGSGSAAFRGDGSAS
jgi:RHS repeat-associated protein